MKKTLAHVAAQDGTRIDYASLRRSPLYDEFCRCTAQLEALDPSVLPDRNSKLAFWINLYNALIVHAVIVLGVQRSVLERGSGFAFFRNAAYKIGGERMSCDDIEHGVLRLNRGHPFLPGPQFSVDDPRRRWVVEPFEPRVHFALNCAGRSCPPIRTYSAERLPEQLELAAQGFLASEATMERNGARLRLSPIFKWYSKDFGGGEGILDFVAAHSPDARLTRHLAERRHPVSIHYRSYDWRLNRMSARNAAAMHVIR